MQLVQLVLLLPADHDDGGLSESTELTTRRDERKAERRGRGREGGGRDHVHDGPSHPKEEGEGAIGANEQRGREQRGLVDHGREN